MARLRLLPIFALLLALCGAAATVSAQQATSIAIRNGTGDRITINWLNGAEERFIMEVGRDTTGVMNTYMTHSFVVRDARAREIDRFTITGLSEITVDGFASNAGGAAVRLDARGPSVGDVLRGLNYDTRRLLAVSAPGSQEVLPNETKRDGGVIVCTSSRVSGAQARTSFDAVKVFSPSSTVFPGSAVWADRALAEGAPAEIGLPLSPVTYTLELDASIGVSRTVTAPNVATVNAARLEMLNEYFANRSFASPANYKLLLEEVESSSEVSLHLGFRAEWTENSASMKANVKSDAKSSTVFGMFTQVYYSVATDVPDAGRYFTDSVTGDVLAAAIERRDAPPGYVQKVDYGRLIMVQMTSTGVHTAADMEAAFKYVEPENDLKAEGDANGKIKTALDSARFDVFVRGGAGDDRLVSGLDAKNARRVIGEVIGNGLKFDKDSAAVPIAYYVKFLDSHDLAKIGFQTDYVEHDCVSYDDRWLAVKMDNGFLANIDVSYVLDGQRQSPLSLKTVSSPYKNIVTIPARATEVRINASMVGINTPTIVNKIVAGNTCVVLKGTVFSQWSEDVADPNC